MHVGEPSHSLTHSLTPTSPTSPTQRRAFTGDMTRFFQRWIRETLEMGYWTGTARFVARAMVDEYEMMSVLRGQPLNSLIRTLHSS